MPTFEPATGLQPVASTGLTGYTLINGTGNVISWTAPNDGNMHAATVTSTLVVSTTETGGAFTFGSQNSGGAGTLIAGAAGWSNIYVAGLSNGAYSPNNPPELAVGPGNTVYLFQSTALTVGAAKMYATIWAA